MPIETALREALSACDAKTSNLVLVLAVSGGLDSMVLLHAAARHIETSGGRILVAHVNHALRETSDRDESFVYDHCKTLDIRWRCRRLAPLPAGQNLEHWAREERYRFFEEIRSSEGADLILTAHHADDVIETFLIRLLANKELRSIASYDQGRHLLRPLLEYRRSELEAYAQQHQIPFVIDESNLDVRFTRNRIRNELLPFLSQKFGAATANCLLERARAAAEDESVFELLAEKVLAGIANYRFGSRDWNRALISALEQYPPTLGWRIVSRALLPHIQYRLSRDKSLEVLEVLRGNQAAAQLPGALEVRRSQGSISVVSLQQ